jgi:colanic acid/amylovoran biosynthesis glycosyltransferase
VSFDENLDMRLAYLLSEYPTLGHTYMLREVRQLRELGWEIQTISIRKPTRTVDDLSSAELDEFNRTWYILGGGPMQFVEAHLATLLGHPLRYCRGLATALQFGSFNPRRSAFAIAYFLEAVCVGHRLRKGGINYLHTHFATTVAFILTHIFDVGLSMTIHGPVEFDDAVGFALRAKVEAAQIVCAISYSARSQVMRWSSPADWRKLELTPLGIDVSNWPVGNFREHPRPFDLISVGRLVGVKGYPLLLEAMAKLREKGRDVRLTLVGEGPDGRDLEEQARRLGIAGRVVFAGLQNQDQLRQSYANSDLCVLTSFAEGVPVVLMEAMATGVPCVAPRIAGIPELIRHGVDGLLFTPSDLQGLTLSIEQIMDAPELRRIMSRSSREQVAEKYDLCKNILHLSKVFSRWMSLKSNAADFSPAAQTHRFLASYLRRTNR